MNYRNGLYEAVSDSKIFEAESGSYLDYIVDKINKLFSDEGLTAKVSNGVIEVVFSNSRTDIFSLKQFCDWFMDYAREAEEYIDNIGDFSGDFDVNFNTQGLVITPGKLS